MLERVLTTAVFTAAIGSGVVGGIFYAFSTFIMPALARIPAEQGTAAMRMINITVINPLFMLAWMGTALICLVLAGGALFWWQGPGGWLILVASLLYLLGCFASTMVFNVPLNNQLAAADAAQLATLWPRYLDVWTMWNHVRAVAPILSAILFTLAMVLK
ncbi:anthrone oxygenase family protein [Phenylobacterium sp.]|uniref:anthrone oxygenase family protein n=1 Tax=Phenylobacterium sp. TaxID=1871053 RepID=UPI002FCC5FD8